MPNRVLIDQTTNTVTSDLCPTIHNSVVVNNETPSNIDVIENVSNIITVTVPGPQGPAGVATSDITGSEYYIPVFSGSTSLVSSTIFQSGSFTSIRQAIVPSDPTNPDILLVDGEGIDTHNIVSARSDRNGYIQLNVQNNNGSTEASSDIVATANNGTETDFYIDMGINSEGYTNIGNVGGANDAYVYSTGNDLYIGNASAGRQVIIFNGGLEAQAYAKIYIHDQGTVGINTNTYNANNPPSLQIEAPDANTYNVVQIYGETDNYSQVAITNRSGGTSASSDLALYNDLDPTNQLQGYVDLGINSSNYVYNGIYPGSAGDAYLFTDSEHLVIGSLSSSANSKVTIFAGGINEADNAKLILYGSNQHQMTGSLNATEGFTGSLYGTSSWALNVVTASNILGGQNNYIPLWSGSSNLTSSILYQNGSYIGVNNPTPSRTLDLISLQSGSYVSVASFMAPNNNIIGNTTQFYLGAQQATGNSISWTFNYQGNNSPANRMGFEFNGYATPVLSMFRNGNSVFGGAIDNGFKHDVQGTGRYTNNLTVTGSVTATTGFTGSLFGTSSWAVSASWAPSNLTGGTANYIPLWTDASSLSTSSLFESANVIKTVYNTNDVGLKLDFPNQLYQLGDDLTGIATSLDSGSGNLYIDLGDYGVRGNGIGLLINDSNQSITTYVNGNNQTPIGLKLDFANNEFTFGNDNGGNFPSNYLYTTTDYAEFRIGDGYGLAMQLDVSNRYIQIGDVAGNYDSTRLTVDDFNSIIKSSYQSNDAGLKLDFANRLYHLGNFIDATGSFLEIDDTTKYISISGSTNITGSLSVTEGITGSLFGTASWAINALTASFGGNFTASNALINGTITAQTLVVQTVTSSIEFVTGSTIFGSLLSNTHQFTGSVSITGSLTLNGSSPIFASQTSSMTVASASIATTASYALNAVSSSYSLTASYALNAGGAVSAFPFTGSALITGSLGVTGSIAITGSLNLGKTNIEFQENTNVTTGTWRVVSSEPTASYRAAFFDYVMFSGSVARAGTVYSVWSASYAEYYENYTGDVGGSTSGVTLQAAISGSNIQLQATASNNAWTIRSLVRML